MRQLAIPALAAASLLAASSALAQEEPAVQRRLPVPFVDRPLTDPKGTLGIGIGGSVSALRSLLTDQAPAASIYTSASVGSSYAFTDDFNISARLVGFDITPRFRAYLPDVGVTQRLIRGPFQLGLSGSVAPAVALTDAVGAPVRSESIAFAASIPMRVYAEHAFKLFFSPRIGFDVPLAHRTVNDLTAVSLSFPLSMFVRVIDPLSIGLGTGIYIPRLDRTKETTTIPASLTMAITVPGRRGPILDIVPSFGFPYLFTPASPVHKVNGDMWSAGLAFNGYVYL
ncbi:MAG: hypothetical protein QM820_34600 [Minicystis sp.]